MHEGMLLHEWSPRHIAFGDDRIYPRWQEYCRVVPIWHVSKVIQSLELLWPLSICRTGQTGTGIINKFIIMNYSNFFKKSLILNTFRRLFVYSTIVITFIAAVTYPTLEGLSRIIFYLPNKSPQENPLSGGRGTILM